MDLRHHVIRSLPSCLFILVVGLAVPHPAAGADTGTDPRQWRRYDGWEVTSFKLEGVPDGLRDPLRSGLALTGRRRLLTGIERPPFAASTLGDDIQRVRLFLAGRGYPASRVAAVLDPRREARQLGVTLRIEPGPEVLVAEVELVEWPELTPRPGDDDEEMPRAGERFSDARIREGLQHLARLLEEDGFARASVEAELDRVDADRVAVRYVVSSGTRYEIDTVAVTGCSDDLKPLARRVMDIEPGVQYRASLLEHAAEDLRTTQLFGRVDLHTERTAPGELALTAELRNARMRSLSASVGTWSDNPWLVRAGWTHRNLFGGGRGLRLRGVYGTHLQSATLDVFRLAWLTPRSVTTAGAEWEREDEDAYRSVEYTARLLQSFRPRGRGLFQVGASVSNVDVTVYSPLARDLPTGQEWLFELFADRKWDWTDDVLYPTDGAYVKVAATWAPEFAFFGASYVQVQADGTVYEPLPGGVRSAARLRLGWSRPLGSSEDLLANRRFYAGGYNTMRGYPRRALGPHDAEGDPRGGQAMVLAGAELRRHLFWILDTAVFLDAGDVWRTAEEADLALLRSAWGVSLGVRTPLGPVRVGRAWNIGPVLEGEASALWHFGIGYPW